MKPFEAAVHRAGIKAEAELRDHPGEVELLDFLDEQLDEENMRAVREHLTWCRMCTAALKGMDLPLGFEIDPELRALPVTSKHPSPSHTFPTGGRKAWLVPVFATAAGFLLALLLFRPGNTVLSGTSLDLALNIDTRGAEAVKPNPTDTLLTLRLELPGLAAGDYKAQFLDVGGKPVFERRGPLRPSAGNRLVITYPLPPSGSYDILVTDPAGREWRYPFRLGSR